jgi:hypothetical protein
MFIGITQGHTFPGDLHFQHDLLHSKRELSRGDDAARVPIWHVVCCKFREVPFVAIVVLPEVFCCVGRGGGKDDD